MPHGLAVLLVVLVYFIIVIVLLTILWRIVIALDQISASMRVMAEDLKKLVSRSGPEGK
ncbi:MAG: hypothetical protein LV479_03450 [Methylacidiphilales bacterium]|nr:hypothetical protein [Candidatus Methylacidiphilales bacterium]